MFDQRCNTKTGRSCAILDEGSVRCWGYYSGGALGYPYPAGPNQHPEDIGDDETPADVGPVDIGAGRTATAISVGGSQTCVILDDARLRCWGALYNDSALWVGDDEAAGSLGPVRRPAGTRSR
ncbi:MAG TPA: hypothetical protein VFV63_01165 [Ilumatobacteraceae bacterium]|nr:hypothetical protein [Ilumatobacteraceae bacterium]